MAATEFRQVVSVFLASPGDLKDEREIARGVVARFNRLYSRFFSLTVELVVWEDVPSAHGRPQEIINRDHLARCELFVGMLNEAWGSNTGKYSSGFEEEFTIAEESLNATGRPAMGLLFKHVDDRRVTDPGKYFAKVLAFKDSIGDRILHKTFKSETEFKEQFEDILAAHVLSLKAKRANQVAQEDQAERGATTDGAAESGALEEGVPQLPPEGVAFLRAFATKAQGPSEAAPLTRVEISRLRLLGTLVSEGNDDAELGVHDANTMFVHRADLDLSDRECLGLLDAGLVQFKSENVPYWHWLERVKEREGASLAMRSLFGSRARRIGALRLMKLLRHPVVEEDFVNRAFYRKYWFIPDTDPAVREAALEYLAVCGIDEDLEAVRAEVDRGGYQTQKASNHAYVRIIQRRNAQEALKALIELDFEGVTEDVVALVFERPEVLLTESLIAATGHRSPRVRRAAAAALRARQALNKDLAEQLSADEAPWVRFEALSARAEAGEAVKDETAKSILVQQKGFSRGLGAFGALGFGSRSQTEGEEQLALFRRETLTRLSAAELKRQVADAYLLDQGAVFEAIRRTFPKRGHELRAGLSDLFKDWFEREFATFAASGLKEDVLNRIRAVEDGIRKEWTRAALNIVTARRSASDLNLVRATLASGYVEQTKEDMAFLRAVGEWSDIETVLAFSDDMKGGGRRSLIGSYLTDEENAFIAGCLCGIAKMRVVDLLQKDLSGALRPWIIRLAPPAAIKSLKNAEIIDFLRDKQDAFRRAVVLRAIASLTEARVASLFKGYMQLESDRYYNATLWLDMATSLERSQAIEIAKRALSEQDG